MDAISYSYADKQAKRIKKFINDPDSTSGVLTVPKVIASGESVTIPAGRVAILPDVQVDGTLNVLGDIFIPTGTANSKVVQKVASTDKAIPRFNGTTGDIQNSGVIIDDSNNVGIGVTPTSTLHIKSITGNTQAKLASSTGTSCSIDMGSDTYNYINALNNLGIQINGTERIRIASNGGITSTGSASLEHVFKPSQTSEYVRISATASDYSSLPSWMSTSIFQYGSTATGNFIGSIPTANLGLLWSQNISNMIIGSNSGSPLIFVNGSTEKMRIDTAGNVGIGTSSPISRLNIFAKDITSTAIKQGAYNTTSNTDSIVTISENLGARGDGNQTFGGRFGASFRRSGTSGIASGTNIGYYAFGGQYGNDDTYQPIKNLYAASIVGVTEGAFTSATNMPTAIVFKTGSIGESLDAVNTNYGTERMRIDANGNVGIGTTPNGSYKLQTNGAIYTSLGSGGLSMSGDGSPDTSFLGYNYTNVSGTETVPVTNRSSWRLAFGNGVNDSIIFGRRAPNTSVNSWTNAMTLDAGGNLLIGTTSQLNGARLSIVVGSGSSNYASFSHDHIFYNCTTGGVNASSTAYSVQKISATGRSINAAGTINASGADYAEYEYSNDVTLVKGQIVGFKEDGTLTDKYSESIRFAIKSTNPSIVGGDVWGCEEIVGKRPEKPVKTEEISDEELAKLEEQYKIDLADFENRLETERQKVDRIAYAGKVPVNVYDAVAGQYVIAIEKEDGTIDGKLVNKADMTFSEYQDAVGRVNKILDDGRAEVAVIIH